MSAAYRILMLEAALLFERHEAGRPKPFNVFSVLRSPSDEVNLHSRFLVALLDYKQSGKRQNLADFLCAFIKCEDDDSIDSNAATIKRESNNVDILICDDLSKQAIVIENKIYAGDQPGQLIRYDQQLRSQGYCPHVLYLTLDGHEASKDSAQDLDYECISYEDLVPWLERCQRRAYDEPGLRESVAQYVYLVQKLTRTDFSEAYMDDLKKLLLKEGNLALAYDLRKAMVELQVDLLEKLWKKIEKGLGEKILDLPDLNKNRSDITKEKIRNFVHERRGSKSHGLYYDFGNATLLGVEAYDGQIFFGVHCEDEDKRRSFKEKLKDGKVDGNWAWWRYARRNVNLKCPSAENLEMLVDNERREQYAREIVSDVSMLWTNIKGAELA